jgi:hypothetical protein
MEVEARLNSDEDTRESVVVVVVNLIFRRRALQGCLKVALIETIG